MTENQRHGRRSFLQVAGAASMTPMLLASQASSQQPQQKKPAPSDKVVIGLIGCGDLGRRHHLANYILKNPRLEVAAVCDVDRTHRDLAAKDVYKKTKRRVPTYKDFRDLCDRRDIDAVFIVVPDHWHALISIYAMESGKDVYCEKPLTLTIQEGRKMVQAARRYGTVFQTGSMQRSDPRFWQAAELVKAGKIGKISKVDTFIGECPPATWQPEMTPPPELDWDMWLGPAPYVDYTPNRCHYEFRWYSDYSGGKMTDWGAHHNDIAQWALGMDESGPVKVKGTGKYYSEGPHDVPKDFDVIYTYANGIEVHCHAKGTNGVRFTGSDGWIFVNREKIEASNPEILKLTLPGADYRNVRDNWVTHYRNFLDCIKTRQKPICDVEIGHRSATMCHLGNIAIQLGRELNWNPQKEEFVNDPDANRMRSRPKRAPWYI